MILDILETGLCVYVCVLWWVCKHVRLVILEMTLIVYVCVVVEAIYTHETENFGNEIFLCLGCCRGYLHMYDQVF